MDEIEKGLKDFLDHWYAGFIRGVEKSDASSQKKMWEECGKACAESYTAEVFREVWKNSAGVDSFLQNLSRRGSDSAYERIGPDAVRATYGRCGCDLVRLGWANSPALCECSAANLRENLRQALGMTPSVSVESSILRGGSRCVLVAKFDSAI
jgi:hypothetical protein